MAQVVAQVVAVVATGGTIASRRDPDGATRAHDSVHDLLAAAHLPPGVEVVGVDAARVGSFALSPADMAAVVATARTALDDPAVCGVVVTHGTDSLEATALLAQLVHADPRPLVLTGAMRAADVPDGDGPRNLGDAVAVAAGPAARDLGVLVVFDGEVLPAVGTRKVHTTGTAAFTAPDAGPLGRVDGGRVRLLHGPDPALAGRLQETGLAGADLVGADLGAVRVDVVASYPGADGALLRAAAAAGARGVVLEGTGAGNATPAVVEAVRELVAGGLVVALTTRVHAGPVSATYGGGGGADLVAAGAVPLTWLRAPQAVVLLTALLATTDPPAAARALAPW